MQSYPTPACKAVRACAACVWMPAWMHGACGTCGAATARVGPCRMHMLIIIIMHMLWAQMPVLLVILIVCFIDWRQCCCCTASCTYRRVQVEHSVGCQRAGLDGCVAGRLLPLGCERQRHLAEMQSHPTLHAKLRTQAKLAAPLISLGCTVKFSDRL
jgi:hypothetical protein